MQPEQKPVAATKSQWLPPRSTAPSAGGIIGPGGCGVTTGCSLCNPLGAAAGPGTRGLISGMGFSCLGSARGQNGGVGFEKETCLLLFQQQKVKGLELAVQIQS